MIDFAREPAWNCPDPDDNGGSSSAATQEKPIPKPQTVLAPKEDVVPWTTPKFTCPRHRRFRARIGPSGGKKGYEAITGEPSIFFL